MLALSVHVCTNEQYTAAGFVARNRDTLLDDLAVALSESKVRLRRPLLL